MKEKKNIERDEFSGLKYIVLSSNSYDDLYNLSGQKPVRTKAKKSISSFRIFKGQHIGAKVTLRRKMMKSFIKRLVNVALLRERNFLGFSHRSVCKNTFSCGFSDISIFPEVDDERSNSEIRGINITMVFSSSDKKDTISHLINMGLPIRTD